MQTAARFSPLRNTTQVKFVDLDLLYQDESILVLNKPPDLLAVPGRGPDKQDCVVTRVRTMFPNMIEQPAVHRLDQQTSGLMVLAVHQEAHRNLNRQFEIRQVTKRYVAIVDRVIKTGGGTITLPLRLDPDHRPYQIYDPLHGKEAITLWEKISNDSGTSRVEFTPLTGRTHQLRVHSAHPQGLDAPIIGDRLYGSGKEGETMLLHATFLRFNHPESGLSIEFNSPPHF